MDYDREKAVAYAHHWAFGRNPEYMNFDGMGGDCTNFISQCLYAGGAPMDYRETFGWYYINATERAPAWTGVEFLYNYMTGNTGTGLFATETDLSLLLPGDVIQLSFLPGVFSHSLIVVQTGETPSVNNTLIACHTDDSDYRPLVSYAVYGRRYLRIGVK